MNKKDEEKSVTSTEKFQLESNYKGLFGTPYKLLAETLVCAAARVLPGQSDEVRQELMVEALQELQPKDYVEGMLCAQIAILHTMGVQFLNSAMNADLRCHLDPDLNNGIKLLRLQHETLEALQKYRRKGEQKVLVQYVQVNEGGKAVVGNSVTAGGGVN